MYFPSLSPTAAQSRFRSILPGQGGTFTHPLYLNTSQHAPSHELTHIGTFGCITCVGVYFEIDDHRCFIAHINAYVDIGNRLIERNCTTREGDIIRIRVLREVHHQAYVNSWNLKLERSRQSLIVVCPEAEIISDERWVFADCADIKHKTGW